MRALSFANLLRLMIAALSVMSAQGGIPREFVVADSARAERVPQTGVRVTYLGTNGYLLEARGATLLVDPYFSRVGVCGMLFNERVASNLGRVRDALAHLPSRVDAILVTHGHVDHLLDVPAIMKATGATIVASRSSIALVKASGISRARCRGVAPGETTIIAGCTVHVLSAVHDRLLGHVPFPGFRHPSPTAPRRVADWVCGEPLAFLVEMGGERIYIDSGGRPELLPPRNIAPIDLAIIGVALPDSRERFADTVRRLRPRYVLPSHQDDFFRPLDRGFRFGLLTDFPRVRHEHQKQRLPGKLILLDYFRPWTLR